MTLAIQQHLLCCLLQIEYCKSYAETLELRQYLFPCKDMIALKILFFLLDVVKAMTLINDLRHCYYKSVILKHTS